MTTQKTDGLTKEQAYQKAYYQAHREQILERQKAYRQARREAKRAESGETDIRTRLRQEEAARQARIAARRAQYARLQPGAHPHTGDPA